jgi:hypothetical protein
MILQKKRNPKTKFYDRNQVDDKIIGGGFPFLYPMKNNFE